MKNLFTGILFGLCAAIGLSTTCVSAADAPVLAQKHMDKGLKCTSCHGESQKPQIEVEKCLKCHGGYEGMAKKTFKQSIYAGGEGLYLRDANPHDSHLGKLACDSCHSGHKASKEEEGVCYKCHTFGWKIP